MAKSWSDRLNAPTEPVVKPAPISIAGMRAGQIMLVPTARMIADFISAVPPGQTVDTKAMRRDLAARHNAEVTCPIYTGYHLRTVAEAAPPTSLMLHRRTIVFDSWLLLIPTDPTWRPEPAAAERAVTKLSQLLPRAEAVSSEFTEDVEFVDAGSNFDTAACPECAADVTEWWFEAMSTASEVAFADLSCTMPCCGIAASLNDLDYDMPVGFSRFALSASNPDVSRFDGDALRTISNELGHPLRTIWRHV